MIKLYHISIDAGKELFHYRAFIEESELFSYSIILLKIDDIKSGKIWINKEKLVYVKEAKE